MGTGTNTLHYIIKSFAMALGDGTKCKTCFGGPRMIVGPYGYQPYPCFFCFLFHFLFLFFSDSKGRVPKKKSRKGVVFCQTGGVLVKSQTSFLDKYFFSEHGESLQDPKNKIYTWSHPPMPLQKLLM